MFRHRIFSMIVLFGMLISQSVPRAMAAGCDSAQFVSDLTFPDGSSVAPGAAFTKTWRLQNNGTCAWDTSYSLVWTGGDDLLWDRMNAISFGALDFLKTLSSHPKLKASRDNRWEFLGLVNERLSLARLALEQQLADLRQNRPQVRRRRRLLP